MRSTRALFGSKGCALRCERSAVNRKGECGGGVVYQIHRHTVISKLKGQLQCEVSLNRRKCSNRISRTYYARLLFAVQVLGLLFLLTTPIAVGWYRKNFRRLGA